MLCSCSFHHRAHRARPAPRSAVFARIYVVWWVLDVGPPVHDSLFLALTVLSWCAVEVPRYSYYALSILDIVPYPLFWLRYRCGEVCPLVEQHVVTLTSLSLFPRL